jgi:peroxiredoxin
MKKNVIILLISFAIVSCNQNNKFSVSGNVKSAEGEVLFLEYTGLLKNTVIDSVRLNAAGKFDFKSNRPLYPDFYRLRLNEKIITFAVDSCESINIEAKATNFATDYKITGSQPSNEIQKLRISVMNIQRKANELNSMNTDERNSKIIEIEKDIDLHKDIARKLILQNPKSTAAYFAIYQQINDTYLFSPYVKEDKPYCAAVATSFNVYMPNYERTKNLYNLVMDAINNERKLKNKEEWNKVLDSAGKGYIDIALKDKNNVERKLSQLEGKVVLIDFSAYENKQSVDYTFALRDIYNRFNKRGFEIFQISMDKDKILWKQATQNIPWICVRDEAGPNTNTAISYNISEVPTTFLMNKQGVIIARSLSFDELNKQIEKCL